MVERLTSRPISVFAECFTGGAVNPPEYRVFLPQQEEAAQRALDDQRRAEEDRYKELQERQRLASLEVRRVEGPRRRGSEPSESTEGSPAGLTKASKALRIRSEVRAGPSGVFSAGRIGPCRSPQRDCEDCKNSFPRVTQLRLTLPLAPAVESCELRRMFCSGSTACLSALSYEVSSRADLCFRSRTMGALLFPTCVTADLWRESPTQARAAASLTAAG